jgi:hypothetical protein
VYDCLLFNTKWAMFSCVMASYIRWDDNDEHLAICSGYNTHTLFFKSKEEIFNKQVASHSNYVTHYYTRSGYVYYNLTTPTPEDTLGCFVRWATTNAVYDIVNNTCTPNSPYLLIWNIAVLPPYCSTNEW